MADLFAYDLANGTSITTNARKLVGDGTSGAGPYTRFGTAQLQAIKIVSSTKNFATSYTAANSNFEIAVVALQSRAEVFYVGIPTASGANQFIALVNANKTDSGNGYGASTSWDGSYENIEDTIGAALGVAEDDITVTEVTLTGLTFA
jgi:hypothetical protein